MSEPNAPEIPADPRAVGRRCSFCHGYQPALRFEVDPPDDYQQVYRFWCSTSCLANWETNQPRPKSPAQERLL